MILKFAIKQVISLMINAFSESLMSYKVYAKFGHIMRDGRIITNHENITLGSSFNMGPNCQLFAQGSLEMQLLLLGIMLP